MDSHSASDSEVDLPHLTPPPPSRPPPLEQGLSAALFGLPAEDEEGEDREEDEEDEEVEVDRAPSSAGDHDCDSPLTYGCNVGSAANDDLPDTSANAPDRYFDPERPPAQWPGTRAIGVGDDQGAHGSEFREKGLVARERRTLEREAAFGAMKAKHTDVGGEYSPGAAGYPNDARGVSGGGGHVGMHSPQRDVSHWIRSQLEGHSTWPSEYHRSTPSPSKRKEDFAMALRASLERGGGRDVEDRRGDSGAEDGCEDVRAMESRTHRRTCSAQRLATGRHGPADACSTRGSHSDVDCGAGSDPEGDASPDDLRASSPVWPGSFSASASPSRSRAVRNDERSAMCQPLFGRRVDEAVEAGLRNPFAQSDSGDARSHAEVALDRFQKHHSELERWESQLEARDKEFAVEHARLKRSAATWEEREARARNNTKDAECLSELKEECFRQAEIRLGQETAVAKNLQTRLEAEENCVERVKAESRHAESQECRLRAQDEELSAREARVRGLEAREEELSARETRLLQLAHAVEAKDKSVIRCEEAMESRMRQHMQSLEQEELRMQAQRLQVGEREQELKSWQKQADSEEVLIVQQLREATQEGLCARENWEESEARSLHLQKRENELTAREARLLQLATDIAAKEASLTRKAEAEEETLRRRNRTMELEELRVRAHGKEHMATEARLREFATYVESELAVEESMCSTGMPAAKKVNGHAGATASLGHPEHSNSSASKDVHYSGGEKSTGDANSAALAARSPVWHAAAQRYACVSKASQPENQASEADATANFQSQDVGSEPHVADVQHEDVIASPRLGAVSGRTGASTPHGFTAGWRQATTPPKQHQLQRGGTVSSGNDGCWEPMSQPSRGDPQAFAAAPRRLNRTQDVLTESQLTPRAHARQSGVAATSGTPRAASQRPSRAERDAGGSATPLRTQETPRSVSTAARTYPAKASPRFSNRAVSRVDTRSAVALRRGGSGSGECQLAAAAERSPRGQEQLWRAASREAGSGTEAWPFQIKVARSSHRD
eukprot:CAMPEP_0117527490 /NCGR_PEP_ID=MMETSP0784-20121206/36825_1 /TAXON_ID=39447 /ORGANISM="" /LENGTH=1020 /DNA_ID=CAMNT_0005323745 /DNA_START=53 /DNA_END=3112 /DNA_ORIENTATION=-